MSQITIGDVDKIETFETVTSLEKLSTKTCMKNKTELFFVKLQLLIIKILQKYEQEAKFKIDKWMKDGGCNGGGITCVLQGGKYIEKVGCNVSAIYGLASQQFVAILNSRGKNIPLNGRNEYFATGMSFLIYPTNPFVPCLHFNYRYFEIETDDEAQCHWFGGSCDLFPNYILEEEFRMFHNAHKKVCDAHDPTFYPQFKKAADEYNFNKHRGEHCGIGGINFDDLSKGGSEHCFRFLTECACTTLPTYLKIFNNHKDDVYSIEQRQWQLVRRGRYAEFILIHGRGTKFGLTTAGIRIESVLMVLPPMAKWDSLFIVLPGSAEDLLLDLLKSPREWVI